MKKPFLFLVLTTCFALLSGQTTASLKNGFRVDAFTSFSFPKLEMDGSNFSSSPTVGTSFRFLYSRNFGKRFFFASGAGIQSESNRVTFVRFANSETQQLTMNEKRRFGIPAIFAESGMEFPVGSKFHFSYSLGAVLRFNPGSQTRYSSGQLFENTVTTPTSTYSLVTTSTKAFNPCLKIEACAGFLFSEKLEGILSLYIQGGITEVAGETLILYNETMGTEYHQVAFKGTQAGIGLGFKFRK